MGGSIPKEKYIKICCYYFPLFKAPHGYLMNSFPKKITNLLFTVIV